MTTPTSNDSQAGPDSKRDTGATFSQSDSRHYHMKREAPTRSKPPSLVPIGFTIGLALFSLVLSLAGFGFRLVLGDNLSTVVSHAAVVVTAFVIGVPVLFWIGAMVMNKVSGSDIQSRNALTLGWLTACVAMLWLMGSNS